MQGEEATTEFVLLQVSKSTKTNMWSASMPKAYNYLMNDLDRSHGPKCQWPIRQSGRDVQPTLVVYSMNPCHQYGLIARVPFMIILKLITNQLLEDNEAKAVTGIPTSIIQSDISSNLSFLNYLHLFQTRRVIKPLGPFQVNQVLFLLTPFVELDLGVRVSLQVHSLPHLTSPRLRTITNINFQIVIYFSNMRVRKSETYTKCCLVKLILSSHNSQKIQKEITDMLKKLSIIYRSI